MGFKLFLIIVVILGIFVVSILFARKNKNKVNSAMSDAEKLAKGIQKKL